MMKFALIALLALYVSLNEDDFVTADCCNAQHGIFPNMKCGDCTLFTPCCGYGKCNIFCCNCAGGCRTGDCSVQTPHPAVIGAATATPSENHVYHVVRKADKNGDNLVDIVEAQAFLTNAESVTDNSQTIISGFHALDIDGDGFLSAQEIDPSIVTSS